MLALVRETGGVKLLDVERPPRRQGFVEIAVSASGLCRTDVYVADGIIQVAPSRILGHEFSGVISYAGPESSFRIGDRVTAFPIFASDRLGEKGDDREIQGYGGEMLGLHRDGSFAEFVSVPESVVVSIGSELSYEEAAFSEPVAAALAVLKAGLKSHQTGCIIGSGRIAQLLARVLKTQGLNVAIFSPDVDEIKDSYFDYVIESSANLKTWRAAIRAVRPGGTVVAKSRSVLPVELPYLDLVQKEVTVKAVHYGSFNQAVELLRSGGLRVDDLVGERVSLSEYQEVFNRARLGEAKKQFFVI